MYMAIGGGKECNPQLMGKGAMSKNDRRLKSSALAQQLWEDYGIDKLTNLPHYYFMYIIKFIVVRKYR